MMMFRTNSSEVFDAIQSDIFAALEEQGKKEVDAWRERISIPVQYVMGPHGGVHVIRSLRGEHPRKETGFLSDSIRSAVEADADLIISTVDTDVDYAYYLDDPTILDRPHAPDTDAFTERALDAIVAAIEG